MKDLGWSQTLGLKLFEQFHEHVSKHRVASVSCCFFTALYLRARINGAKAACEKKRDTHVRSYSLLVFQFNCDALCKYIHVRCDDHCAMTEKYIGRMPMMT